MPVSFLTAEQERRYGQFAGEPSQDQLARHFHLDDADREAIGAKRWDHMRLGYAVQLGTVRFLGTFLEEPTDVPAGIVVDLARQLAIADPACLARYAVGRARWQHAREIRKRHGYREFTEPLARFRLARWLYALCWTGTDRPSVLFDHGMAGRREGAATRGVGPRKADRPDPGKDGSPPLACPVPRCFPPSARAA